jgi:hypothetical protein
MPDGDHSALPRTPQDAEWSGDKYYFTGVPCPKGHVGPRYTKKRNCVQCCIDSAMKRYQRTSDRNICGASRCPAATRLYWHLRYETKKVLKGREHLKGPRTGNCCGKRKCPASLKLYRLIHYETNRETYYAAAAGRRGRMRHGCPPEHRDELNRIYAECPPGHVVDHIVPLNGKTVSGLHVPWNLQHLPVLSNRKKSARFDEAAGFDYTAPGWCV